jgi:hypothetical protein
MTFSITAADPDSPNGPLAVQLTWTISDSDGVHSQSGAVDASLLKGSAYEATIPPTETSGWCDPNTGFLGSGDGLDFTVTTTDEFGGVTRRSFKLRLQLSTPLA